MEIYLLRHAESLFNIGESDERDIELSINGISQAKLLTGYYDIIICSPLRRCLDTLNYSKITFDTLIIEPLVREQIVENSDLMVNEIRGFETEFELLERIDMFKNKLNLMPNDKKILIIGHSDYFWHLTSYTFVGLRFGKWIKNAEIIRLEQN